MGPPPPPPRAPLVYIYEKIALITRQQMAVILVFAFLLVIVPGSGMAQQRFVHCQLSTVTDTDFGELDFSLPRRFQTTADLNIRCNQGEPGATIYVCLHLGSGTGGGNRGARLMRGPDRDRSLQYNIYGDPYFRGDGGVWGGNLGGFGGGPPLFTLTLDDQGSREMTRTLYFEALRPRRQIVLPLGAYVSNFRQNTHSRMEYGYDSGNNCNDPLDFGRADTNNDNFRALNTGFSVTATVIEPTQVFGFSKAFDPDTVGQGGTSRLTFTIDGSATVFRRLELTFTDNFPDGMVVAPEPDASTTCTGGTVSATAGGTTVGFSDGTIEEGETCTVAVNVRALLARPLDNKSGDLTAKFIPGETPGAEARLTVVPPAAPGFARVFTPATIRQGGETEIVFTVDNGANAIEMTEMAFDDALPEGVSVADTPGASNSCGGTFSPVAGAARLALTGGTLAAGATCEIRVTVRAIEAGPLIGPAVDLTSSIATATAAEAMLTVNPAAPGFARVFTPATIPQGGETEIVFTVDNGANAIEMTEMAFDDALPEGVSVADTPGASNSCGGTFSPVAGAARLALTGGTLAAGATCEIRVTVRAIEAGPLIGPAVDLTSSIATATAAEAMLTVNPAAPGFARVFTPATIPQGGETEVVFTVDNGANAIEMTEMAFDDALPEGVSVADTPGASNSCGGTFSPVAGAARLALTGGTLAAGATCEIRVTVRAIEAGPLIGPAVDLTSSIATATAAEAMLTVNPAAPGFARVFTPATIRQGGETEIVFTVDNGANAIEMTEMAFDDALPEGVSVADTPGASNSCGGTFSPVAGAARLALTGGTLAAGATCEIRVTVRAIEAGPLIGPAVDLTSSIATATAAEAMLTVNPAAPGFARVFTPATIRQGGETEVVFTVDNGANAIEMTEMAFDDALPEGVSVADTPGASNSCGGTFSPVAGAARLALTGGTLAAGATCEIRVTVRAIEAGPLIGPAVDLTSSIATATAAEAMLTVNPAAPGFARVFTPATIRQGGETEIVFTVDNGANAIEMTEMAFDDALPEGVSVADTPGASNSCGGTFSPVAGAARLALTGGTLAAGATCEIRVTVRAIEAGPLIGPAVDLTSSIATATAAEAMLTVNPAAPGFARVFTPATIPQGGETEVVFTVDNGANAIEMTEMAFDDALPEGVSVADTPGASNSCGGTFSPVAGAARLALTGGTLAAGATCEIRVTVRAIEAGPLIGPAVDLTSSIATATAAEAMLTVNPAAPGFARVFTPATIRQGGETEVVFTVDNGANAIEMTEMAFDDALPEGVSVADTPGASNSCGGTFSPVAGAARLALTGGTLAAGATCEIRVTVRAIEAGPLIGPAVDLTSSIATATAAEAMLTVNPAAPGFARVFTPATIRQGGETEVVFTVDNGANAIEMTEMAFDDALPEGVSVADTPGASNSCGGTFSPVAGAARLALTGGTLAAGATCEIRVTVRAIEAGPLIGPAVDLTSSIATATAAEAMLTVNPAAPGFARVFTPATIRQGGETEIVFTVDNGANAIEMTEMAFDDALPEGVSVADTPGASNSCGGTFSPVAGATTLAFTGGVLAAGATCELRVTVRATGAGTLTGPAVDLTSSIATATAAEAMLTVNPAAPGFARVFTPATIPQGGETEVVFTVDNGANAIEMTEMAFDDALPEGVSVADTPGASNSCGGTFSPVAGAARLALTGGTLAAGATCEIRVTVRAIEAGPLIGPAVDLTSSIATATAAEAMLTVNPVAPGFVRVFTPATIPQGGETEVVFTVDNGANAIAMTEMAFDASLPEGVSVADTPGAGNSCGGTFSPVAGATTLAFTGGVLAAGVTCELRVTVRATGAGTLTGPEVALRSSIATATAAEAMLTVNPAAALGFAKAFLPDTVDPGGVSRLTYRIDNAANLIDVGSLSFDDDFPEGLAVAPEPNADNTCGGTFAPAASATSLVFSGGLVAAGGSCTLAVDVQALVTGPLTGTSGDLTSDLPVNTPGVSATLTVREAPLSVSMAFEPSTIGQGGVSRLTYGLNNGEPVAATSVALSDTLPTGVVVADPPDAQSTCTGGTLTAAAGGGDVSYSGGSLAAATACTIAVDVTSVAAGSHLNRTERVTSSLGTSAAAEAMLTVYPAGTVTFNVESDTDGIFDFSSAEPILTVSLEVDGGTGSTGALAVATGSYSVAVAAPTGVALTAIACDDTDSTADVSAAAMISVTVDAAEAITCTLTAQSSVQPTVEAINSFLTRRADLILSSGSDPHRRFERLNRGSGQASALRYANGDLEALVPFTVQGGISFTGQQGGNGGFEVSTSLLQVRQAAASAALASGSAGDVAYVENYRFGAWFEAQYKQFGGGSDEHGDFAIAYFGMDYLVKPDVLVGALVSLDTMEEVTDTSTVSGFGYMIGPYVTAQLASNLYFDGHVAVGRSDNRISPFNTYTDTFRTGRWLARGSLTGEARHGNWTIRPHARLGYFEETQQRYTDSVGATIPSQTVRLGQLKIGPTFTGRFEGPEGWTWAPYLEVEGIYNIGDTTGVTLTDTNGPEVEGWRARLKAGVGLTTGEGTRLSLGATHDGLGRSDFENWGLKFELSIPFGKPKR